jgi:DNA helicase-2/ATP-dependent DNA helicase PcrA
MPRAAPKSDEVGGRYVDRDFFADDASAGDDGGDEGMSELRRGSRVWHERFGEGLVRDVVQANEPAVVAHFPGWGEKKVLLRFLRAGPPRRS